jgi:hypothetical protein
MAKGYRRILGSRVISRAELLNNQHSGCTVHRFGTAERYEFERPRHIGDLPTVIEAKVGECTVPAPFVIDITDATVIGPSAVVSTDGRLLLESALGGDERLVDASVLAVLSGQFPFETRFQRPDRQYNDPIFSLVGPWATEYYHWLVDYLVQVFAIEIYRKRTGQDPRVLIPAGPPSWLLYSLSMAGVDMDRLVEWSGTRARCSDFILGSLRRKVGSNEGYIHSPAAVARLGERIRNSVANTHLDGPKRRLYVSRSDTTDRQVRNEDALLSTLDDYGFERIVPGEHSFKEQVRRFANAELILGPHGAGLTNMMFSEQTMLIELFGSYRNACFFALARGMGHEYVSVTCSPKEADMIVDTEAVESLLDDIVPRD